MRRRRSGGDNRADAAGASSGSLAPLLVALALIAVGVRVRRRRGRRPHAKLVLVRGARRVVRVGRRALQQGVRRPLPHRARRRCRTTPTSSASSWCAGSRPRTATSTSSAWTSSGPPSSPRPAGSCRSRDEEAHAGDRGPARAGGAERDLRGPAVRGAVHQQHPAPLVPQEPHAGPADDLGGGARRDRRGSTRPGKPHQFQVQGQRYEGLVVWFTSLARVGRHERPRRERHQGRARAEGHREGAAASCGTCPARRPPHPPSPPPGRTTAAWRGSPAPRPSWSTTRSSGPARTPTPPDIAEDMGWARYPGIEGGGPSKVTIGGFNLGVGAFGEHPDLAFDAAACITSEETQLEAAIKGGLLPTSEALYDEPELTEATQDVTDATTGEDEEGQVVPVRRRAEGDAGRRGPAAADALLQRRRPGHRPDPAPDPRHRPEGRRGRPPGRHRAGPEGGGPPVTATSRRCPSGPRGRAQARLDAVGPGGDRDAARHRVPDRLRDLARRSSATTCASPTTASSSGSRNYGAVLTNEVFWQDLTSTLIITVISVVDRAGPRVRARLRDAPGDLRPGPGAGLAARALRDHHRRRRLRLALRLRPHHRVRQRPAQHRPELVLRELVVVPRDHRHRGLEDDAVHGAPAAGRLHARARRRGEGGPGRRRHRVAAAAPRSSSR